MTYPEIFFLCFFLFSLFVSDSFQKRCTDYEEMEKQS